MRRCVWSRNLMNEEAMARVGPKRHRRETERQRERERERETCSAVRMDHLMKSLITVGNDAIINKHNNEPLPPLLWYVATYSYNAYVLG